MSILIKRIINSPIASNCYVLYDTNKNSDCILVDPGSCDCKELDSFLSSHSLNPTYIILTHEHFDHIWGCDYLRKSYNCKIICSESCSDAITDRRRNLSLFYNQIGFELNAAELVLKNDIDLNWNDYILSFFITKGHSPGGICVCIDKFLFTGDTLLKDIRTVTKLHSGSVEDLKKSLIKISKLNGQGKIVCPGHGDSFELDGYDLRKALMK